MARNTKEAPNMRWWQGFEPEFACIKGSCHRPTMPPQRNKYTAHFSYNAFYPCYQCMVSMILRDKGQQNRESTKIGHYNRWLLPAFLVSLNIINFFSQTKLQLTVKNIWHRQSATRPSIPATQRLEFLDGLRLRALGLKIPSAMIWYGGQRWLRGSISAPPPNSNKHRFESPTTKSYLSPMLPQSAALKHVRWAKKLCHQSSNKDQLWTCLMA